MKNERKIGVVLTYLSQGIHLLTGLLYTPLMLRLLGQSEYGLYQLVYSVVSYLGLLSFGFSSSYMRFYARYKNENDEKKIAKLNGMFMTIFLCISFVCIVSGTIMIINVENIFASGLTVSEYGTARILMIILILNLALTFPNAVFDCFTTAHERFLFQKLLVLLSYIFNPMLTLPLLLMGYGSVAMVMVTVVITLVKLIVNIVYSREKLKIKFDFKKFDFMLLKEMWLFTFFIFLNMIVDQINWNVDKFLLGRYVGTTAVAIYGIGGQLNSLYLQFSTAVSGVFIPKVNKIVANNDDNKVLSDLFIKIGRIQFLILGWIISGFVFFGRDFIYLWAGNGYEKSYRIALFLMVPVTVPLIQNLGIEIQRAKNKHKVRAIVYTVISVSNIFVSIPCIHRWGAEGAAVGTALTLILGNCFFMNWYYYKHIQLDILKFWKNIICQMRGLIGPIIIGVVIDYYFDFTSIIKLLIGIVLYSVVYVVFVWCFSMNKDERNIIYSLQIKSQG